MEKTRQKSGESIQSGTMQGGSAGHTGEQADHRKIRALSTEVPGTEAMLSDPGEPHKSIEQHRSPPEEKGKASGTRQKPGEPRPGWQEHPILGKEAVSAQNEKEERARRKMEHERSGKKKPAA
jgi:hypothetical protein